MTDWRRYLSDLVLVYIKAPLMRRKMADCDHLSLVRRGAAWEHCCVCPHGVIRGYTMPLKYHPRQPELSAHTLSKLRCESHRPRLVAAHG